MAIPAGRSTPPEGWRSPCWRASSIAATLKAGYVYQWLLPLVSVAALVVVIAAVHPSSRLVRLGLGWAPLVAVGKRSYGLYLWHWPVFVLAGATHGSVRRCATAAAITVVVAELSYRYVETPARRGALGAGGTMPGRPRPGAADRRVRRRAGRRLLWRGAAVRPGRRRHRRRVLGAAGDGRCASRWTAARRRRARPPTTPATTAVRLAVVGDSQAHSLSVNVPDGLEDTFLVEDGAIDGCSVYDEGRVRSARTSFRNSFEICAGWQAKWADAVARSGASVALVVLGAWDVFDRETADGSVLTFGTAAWDADLRTHLEEGIDALTGAGAAVAILEVPCMRPISVEGAAVPPLPERADDARVAHVNDVLRDVAASNAATTRFVDGPDWCGDEALATDTGMRWDGVHVYKPGAKLILDTIAPTLLTM